MATTNDKNNNNKEQKIHDAYAELGKKGGNARKEQRANQGSSSNKNKE